MAPVSVPDVTIGDVRRARPEVLHRIATILLASAGQWGRRGLTIARLAPNAEEWSGPAYVVARQRHTELVEATGRMGDGVERCARAVRAASHDVAAAQRLLRHAESAAVSVGAVVRDDGVVVGGSVTVEVTDPSAGMGRARALAEGARTEYALALTRLVAAVDDAIQRCAVPIASMRAAASTPRGLASLPAGSPRTPGRSGGRWGLVAMADQHGGGSAWVPQPALGPSAPPEGPAAASSWFAALTGAERDWVVDHHPTWVGPRDGLPAWARDRANRVLLADLELALVAELDARGSGRVDPADYWGLMLYPDGVPGSVDLDAAVAGVRAVAALLAREDGRQRQLLSIGMTAGVLTAAVSSGDLDGAGHIAVFVPGFQADVAGDLGTYSASVQAAADLADRLARDQGDGRPVVGLTWLGYAAPAVAGVLLPGKSVAGWTPAVAGASRLAGTLDGLAVAGRAAYPHDPPRVVVWGHSYGSVVTGLALRAVSTPVAGVVVFGSPGLSVDDAAALRVPSGGLFVEEALDDAVAALGRFGADPGRLPGARQLSVAAHVLPDGSPGTVARGHEEYLVPGSTSQWNLAAVAAGLPELTRALPSCPRWSPLSGVPKPRCEQPLRVG